jgi:branched-subunit amino acid aminotransferase/4-amino-4-deoxychorismate lyase
MELKIYLDGALVPESQAKVSVFDHGLLYGDGVFEGIRFLQWPRLPTRTTHSAALRLRPRAAVKHSADSRGNDSGDLRDDPRQ